MFKTNKIKGIRTGLAFDKDDRENIVLLELTARGKTCCDEIIHYKKGNLDSDQPVMK